MEIAFFINYFAKYLHTNHLNIFFSYLYPIFNLIYMDLIANTSYEESFH